MSAKAPPVPEENRSHAGTGSNPSEAKQQKPDDRQRKLIRARPAGKHPSEHDPPRPAAGTLRLYRLGRWPAAEPSHGETSQLCPGSRCAGPFRPGP